MNVQFSIGMVQEYHDICGRLGLLATSNIEYKELTKERAA
jgi:hypothetical protein